MLLPLLHQKLIPWAQEGLDQRLIVAQPTMKKSSVPSDVMLTRKQLKGKRVIVRDKRVYGNQRVFYASWPEDGLHELDVPKLICIINGVGDFQVGDYLLTCNQGHFIFFPPRTPTGFSSHSYKNNEKSSFTLLQINLYRDSIHCMMSQCLRGEEYLGDAGANCLIYHPQAVQTFKLLVEELLSDPKIDFAISGLFLSALFLIMALEIAAGHQLNSFHTLENNAAPKTAQEVRDYIKAHLPERLTIGKMAREMYISPSQFTQYIKQESGQTFVEILTECRLSEAKFMLQETKWSITAIAARLGFKSSTYFGNFFRQHVGVSPGMYRKNLQKAKMNWNS